MAGGQGEGLSRNMFKGTWTKPKGVGSKLGGRDGWGREEWWEENGDNYT